MIRFLARGRLHRALLKHVFLMMPLVSDASQVHTKSCGVISGISQV
jgi:hypothetical protein